MRFSGSQVLHDMMGTRATEDDEIQEGVCAKSVRAVNRHTCSLTGCIQTRDNLVLAILTTVYERMRRAQLAQAHFINSQHLASISGGNTTHCRTVSWVRTAQ
jgi:hypothetical protein